MIVVHTLWDNLVTGQLRIWAESSALPLTISKRTGTSSKVDTARPHPFAFAREPLVEALSDLAGSLLMKDADTESLSLRLPSSAKRPLPSPQLLLNETIDVQGVELKPWNVVTLTLDAGWAMDFLLALPASHLMAWPLEVLCASGRRRPDLLWN